MTYNSLLFFYYTMVVPYLGAFLDLAVLVSSDSAKFVAIFFKDFLLFILILSSLNFFIIRKFGIFLIFSSFYYLSSILWNDINLNFEVALAGIRNSVIYPITFFIGLKYSLSNNKNSSKFIMLFTASVYFNLISGLLQALGLLDSYYLLAIGKDNGLSDYVWVHGGFISYIEYAFFLTFASLTYAILFYKGISKVSTRKLLMILFLCLIMVLVSQSRTGAMAFLLITILLIYYFNSKVKFVTLIALFSLIVFFIFMITPISHRLLSSEASEDIRFVYILPLAYEFFIKSPIIGNGLGSFGAATTFSNNIDTGFEYLDSSILSILLQFGIIGFILYFGFILFNFYHIHRCLLIKNDSALIFANTSVFILFIIYSFLFNFIDGWPGAIFIYSWLGFMRGQVFAMGSFRRKQS